MLPRAHVVIRALRREDEPVLFALAEQSFGESLPSDDTVAVLTRCLVFVAEADDGEIAGYVALLEEGPDLCIRQLLVSPMKDEDDRHVGDQLCDWVEGYGINHGFERVRIDLGDDEERARHFYARRGYRPARIGGLERELPRLAGGD